MAPLDALLVLGPSVYELAARQSAVAMFLVAPDGRFVHANPAACRMFGLAEEQLLKCTLNDVSDPRDLAWSRKRLVEALEERTSSYRIHKRYLRSDGGVIVADVTVSLLSDDQGQPLGFLASAVDDTARVEAAERADASHALMRASMDTLLDPWVLLRALRDESGRIEDFAYREANKEACRHNGIAHDQLVGARLLTLFPDHRGPLLQMYAHVVDTGEPLVLDDHPFVTDGRTHWFDNRAVRVGSDDLSFTWRDVTEAHMLRDALTQQATTDPLTGVFNRSGLAHAISRLASPDRRARRGFTVLYLDLDGLTTINNTHGHPAGDLVLRAVADRIAGTLRTSDVVARVGGDEFVVLAPDTDEQGAHQLAAKISQAVERPVRTTAATIVPSVSIGSATGTNPAALDDLITAADQTLLRHKSEIHGLAERGRPSRDPHSPKGRGVG